MAVTAPVRKPTSASCADVSLRAKRRAQVRVRVGLGFGSGLELGLGCESDGKVGGDAEGGAEEEGVKVEEQRRRRPDGRVGGWAEGGGAEVGRSVRT